MRFSPQLPDDPKEGAKSATGTDTGSYDALMAKLGRTPAASDAESAPAPSDKQPLTSDSADDGFEVDREQADEAVEGMPPQVSGPVNAGAKLLSWLMVPLVMPIVSMAMMIWLTPLRQMSASDKLVTMLVVAGANTVMPMIIIGLLKVLGVVRDIGLNSRRERLIPYIIIIAGLAGTAWFLKMQGAAGWMYGTYVGAAIASAICCIVNFWWKISAHATGAAGVIGVIAVIGVTGNAVVPLQWWLFGACLLTGLMGSARVFLRRHTDLQVIAGFVCGFCCVYFTSLILN